MIFDESKPVEIDSFNLRVPAELIQVHAPELIYRTGHVYAIDDDTGEMVFVRETSLNSARYDDETYSTTYAKKRTRHDSASEEIDCMNIGVSAKLVKRFYYDGVTEGNINYGLNNLEAQGIITIPDRSAFIQNARCTDIDLKQDRILTEDQWKHERQTAISLTRESKKKGQGYVDFKGQGIQYAERHAKQTTIANPFVKLYPKKYDFQGKSAGFYKRYLQGITSDVYRTEGTLKNRHDLKAYSIDSTLMGLLRTPQETLRNTLGTIVNRQIDLNSDMKYTEPDSDMFTASQLQDIKLFQYIMQVEECTFETAMNKVCIWRNSTPEQAKQKKIAWRKLWKQHESNQWKEFRRKYAA